MMIDVEITKDVVLSAYGRVKPGDSLRLNDDYAKYVVAELKAAKYITNEKQAKDSRGK